MWSTKTTKLLHLLEHCSVRGFSVDLHTKHHGFLGVADLSRAMVGKWRSVEHSANLYKSVIISSHRKLTSRWWLNRPSTKYATSQNGFIFPKDQGENKKTYLKPPPSKISPGKMMVGRWFMSFFNGPFSGDMLISRWVYSQQVNSMIHQPIFLDMRKIPLPNYLLWRCSLYLIVLAFVHAFEDSISTSNKYIRFCRNFLFKTQMMKYCIYIYRHIIISRFSDPSALWMSIRLSQFHLMSWRMHVLQKLCN